MTVEWSLKRAFLRTLIVALVSSALVGIYTFLFGEFGETTAKILFTTLSISYFSVTSLACAAALEKNVARQIAFLGLIVSLVGFLIFMPGIWAEWDSESVAKTMAIFAIFAFSFGQVCLLTLVPLTRSFQWLFFATAVIIFTLATLSSGMLLSEANEEWLFRLVGALGILDGCGSLLIPVLSKLSGETAAAGAGKRFSQIQLTCPACGREGVYPVGTINCPQCSLEIRVEIRAKSPPIPGTPDAKKI